MPNSDHKERKSLPVADAALDSVCIEALLSWFIAEEKRGAIHLYEMVSPKSLQSAGYRLPRSSD